VQELAERGDEACTRHLPQLQAICLKGLQDPELAVRQAALHAVSGFIGASSSRSPVLAHTAVC
jgi:hypothetical protein